MHREDWDSVYANQDKILDVMKRVDTDIFLAGGTGLHRFVLSKPYRHSEDLDFFFPTLQTKKELDSVVEQIVDTILSIDGAKLENKIWLKEEQSYRMWYSFKENREIVKIELLNFTCNRPHDTSFREKDIPFKTENLYNLLLYKLKALCDRPDTIKDLFDLYFILREFSDISIDKTIKDLNNKFENAIKIKYNRSNIINALNHNLTWDIEIGEIEHLYDMQSEIKTFQDMLKKSLSTEERLDFTYQNRISQRAKYFDMDIQTYIDLMDVLEGNSFWVSEAKV